MSYGRGKIEIYSSGDYIIIIMAELAIILHRWLLQMRETVMAFNLQLHHEDFSKRILNLE